MRVSYRASWTKSFKTEAAEWIRFTFQPTASFFLSIVLMGALIAIAIVRDNPLLVLIIFSFAIVIFLGAMAVSFFTWYQFKRFNQRNSK